MINEAIKVDFKGIGRNLRFGIGPSRILCQEKGITVSEMQELDTNELIQDMILASLKFDRLIQGLPIDFNQWEVYQWITDMDQESFQGIFDVFIKTRVVGQSIYDIYIKNLEKLTGDVETIRESSLPEKKN